MCLHLCPSDGWLCFHSPSSLKLLLHRGEGGGREWRREEGSQGFSASTLQVPLSSYGSPLLRPVCKCLMPTRCGLSLLLLMKEGSGKWVVGFMPVSSHPLHPHWPHPILPCHLHCQQGHSGLFPAWSFFWASREAHGKELASGCRLPLERCPSISKFSGQHILGLWQFCCCCCCCCMILATSYLLSLWPALYFSLPRSSINETVPVFRLFLEWLIPLDVRSVGYLVTLVLWWLKESGNCDLSVLFLVGLLLFASKAKADVFCVAVLHFSKLLNFFDNSSIFLHVLLDFLRRDKFLKNLLVHHWLIMLR